VAKKKAKPKAKKPARKPAKKAKKAAAKKPVKKAAKKSAKKAPKKPAVNPEKLVPGGVLVGEVADFFAHVGVIALTLQKPLAVGDTIRIKGHTTDLTQKVESLQIEHEAIQAASAKDAVGIKIVERARKGDFVYKV